MIFITVKSEIMDCKRQFEQDLKAERFLKRVKLIHDLVRYRLFLKDLLNDDHLSFWHRKAIRRRPTMGRVFNIARSNLITTCIPLKINIQNTEAAQLNLINQLTK